LDFYVVVEDLYRFVGPCVCVGVTGSDCLGKDEDEDEEEEEEEEEEKEEEEERV
jgi:hypothetical protein